ncbi:Putative odorant receptor 13a [Camponotus floridanus]|uniref:Putative odorant receptor 13a n=1 Tax=Camponotus floridanus TaxID=104421 RepID=E2AF60_CAMFO|nr:Putative odorant receptor 13a [Camponotus floridanus]
MQYNRPSRDLEYLIGISNLPTYIYIIYSVIENIVLILATTANLGNDALFLNITLHVCGQVNILRIRFIKFDVTSPRICDRFNELIQRHHYVIMLARELADLINFILLIELFIISILLCIMGNDALFLNIILHVCGQANILKIRFINFDVTSPQIYDRFNKLIQRHRYVIMLARKLADLMSFVLLIELFIISILLCIVGFQLIFALKVNDTVMIGKSSIVLSGVLTQLTLYSFIGNYLKSEMEEIGLSIYQSAWYSFPRKLIKSVIFILMQTKSPVALQAGNFIVVNLSTYVSILKTSFSYLSVLRIMLGV